MEWRYVRFVPQLLNVKRRMEMYGTKGLESNPDLWSLGARSTWTAAASDPFVPAEVE